MTGVAHALTVPEGTQHQVPHAGRQALYSCTVACTNIINMADSARANPPAAQPSGAGHARLCFFPSSLSPTSGSTAIFLGVFYVVV